jgi:anti-anti-sigma factor
MTLLEPSSVASTRGVVASLDGRDAERTLISLRGEHDASTVAALSDVLALAVALDAADLVVDLSDVEFMSAATVGVIVRTRVLLRSQSRTLELRHPSSCARRVLDACRVDLIDRDAATHARRVDA